MSLTSERLITHLRADPADVDALAERLGRDGVPLVGEPDTLQTPGGGYGFRFFDNDGRTIEVSCDVEVRDHRRVEEGESIPVELSHVVVNSPNAEATVAFYDRHLQFALSDTLTSPHMGDVRWFLRTNTFHHSLAIARGPHRAGNNTSSYFLERTAIPSSTPPSSRSSTRTPGTRTSTTSPTPSSPTSGARRTR